MARPKGNGIKVVRAKRPDGTVVEYFYDRATKKFLGHDHDAALALVTSPEQATPEDPSSISSLITRYLARPEFRTKLKPRTQKLYRGYLDEMRRRYGDLSIRSFGPEAIEDKAEGDPAPAH